MDPTPTAIATSLEILSSTPKTIALLTDGLTNKQLTFRPDPKAWSANDILAHLRACADVWGQCIKEILVKNHPTLQEIHPRIWVKKTNYLNLDFNISLEVFTSQRETLLSHLESLSDEDWWRAAVIVTQSKSREQTVFQYVRRMAKHEEDHRLQIKSLVKSL